MINTTDLVRCYKTLEESRIFTWNASSMAPHPDVVTRLAATFQLQWTDLSILAQEAIHWDMGFIRREGATSVIDSWHQVYMPCNTSMSDLLTLSDDCQRNTSNGSVLLVVPHSVPSCDQVRPNASKSTNVLPFGHELNSVVFPTITTNSRASHGWVLCDVDGHIAPCTQFTAICRPDYSPFMNAWLRSLVVPGPTTASSTIPPLPTNATTLLATSLDSSSPTVLVSVLALLFVSIVGTCYVLVAARHCDHEVDMIDAGHATSSLSPTSSSDASASVAATTVRSAMPCLPIDAIDVLHALGARRLDDAALTPFPLVSPLGSSLFNVRVGHYYVHDHCAMPVSIKSIAACRAVALDTLVHELCLVATLDHPSVVAFLGFTWRDARFSLVYEHLDQGSLRSFLVRHAVLTWHTKATLALDVALALAHMHARGIAHLDMHAGNVWMQWPHAKLGGFGAAAAMDENEAARPRRRRSSSSVECVAPEVFVGGAVVATAAADMFAFGCFLVEVETHEMVYAKLKLTPAQIFQKRWQEGLMPIVPDGAKCPPAIRKLMVRCLDCEPTRRPTAEDAAAMLHMFVHGA
ncbi:Aste57867_20796 [Aphanomyces stellatus]|uniref:Aste57867_20796 protein n=1 Tax=Aphanomyces stellatus TaxID=120398 RepID=A0A485LH34_9STRA|nr:hypothetical protein As57867_020728 [Aphanomyces stellatus]VFT97475.1 Aste57867_20796 [Aphanomyces stellatus]